MMQERRFWGKKLDKKTKTFRWEPDAPQDVYDVPTELSISQVALGPSKGKEKTVLSCTVDAPDGQGKTSDTEGTFTAVLCTLTPGVTDQFAMNLIFNDAVTFTITGPGPLYLTGVEIDTEAMMPGMGYDGDEDGESDEEDDEEDDEEEEEEKEKEAGSKRKAAAKTQPTGKRTKTAQPAAQPDEDEEGESEDEDYEAEADEDGESDEDEEEDEESDDAAGEAEAATKDEAGEEDADEGESDDEDEDEDEEEDGEGDESEGEDDEGESDEGESDEEEEEEAPAKKAPAKKAPAKKAQTPAKKGDAEPHDAVTVERILKMANTPKKEKKFVNFCKNTFKLTDEKEIGSLWTGYKKAKGI